MNEPHQISGHPKSAASAGFDVFLSHNSKDKPAVRDLMGRLSQAGLRVWLDEDELRPGIPWQQLLEDGIRASASVAVLVGSDGLGPWEDEEMQAALRLAVKDKRPVIPVLLPGTPAQPKLPLFLSSRTWVDLRAGLTTQTLEKLIWGITGKRPGEIVPTQSVSSIRMPTTTGDASPISPFSLLPSPFSLTPPVADFTGRDSKLQELRQLVKQGNVAITGLRGLGGAGKTELARKLAAELKSDYPDAQIELNLKGVDPQPLSPIEVLSAILRSFHPTAKLPDDIAQLALLLRQTLDGKRVLLLLDNVKDAQQIKPVLPLPAGCLAFVTSRQRFVLPGLAVVDLGVMEPDDARKLLVKIAPRIGSQADSLAEACGRLPLALRLAASLLASCPQITPAAYVRQLCESRERVKLLDKAKHSSAEDLGLEASLGLSSQQVAPLEQQRLSLLCVFPASFDRAAAQAVWSADDSATADTLDTLVGLSLLEWNEKTQRFGLHDLLRDFACARANTDDLAAAHRRHAEHFLHVVTLVDQLYLNGGENVLKGLAIFDRERAHVEAAFDWLNSRAESDLTLLLASLVDALAYVGALRFHPQQRIRWLEVQLKAARTTGDRRAQGVALGNLGLAYSDLGDTRKAIENHKQSLAIARKTGNRGGVSAQLGNLGIAYDALGDAHKAVKLYKQALAIAREIRDQRCEGNTLGSLGNAYVRLGDARKAVGLFKKRLAITRKIGDRRGEGAALGNLGDAYFALAETRRATQYESLRYACQYHKQELEVALANGDRLLESHALANLGKACLKLGDAPKAIEYYERALLIDRETGDRRGEGTSLYNSAAALWRLGSRTEANTRAQNALRIFDAIEDPNAAKVRAQLEKWRNAQ